MPNSAFGFEKPEQSPGFLLWQTMITWQRQIKKALDPYDISHAQFVILANVLWFEGIKSTPTQILIVRSTKLDKMTVSKSLKKLVAQGYIKRAEDKDDSRAKSARLTHQGKTITTKLVREIEKIDGSFFGAINKSDKRSLLTILATLVANTETTEQLTQ